MPAISFQYSFDLTISVPDLNKVSEHRLRVSHTASEPLERTYAKVLAFCHNFEPDLQISNGSGDHLEPVLFRKDLTGEIITWIDIGCPSIKKFSKPVRSHKAPEVKLYFYRFNHRAEFRSEFHGFKREYLRPVLCYQLDPNFLTALTQSDQRNSTWNLTFIENSIYIEANGVSFDSVIEQIDLLKVLSGTEHTQP